MDVMQYYEEKNYCPNCKKLAALKIIKKYFELTEDNDENEIFKYGLRDKQYISSRSSLCIQKEEFDLLKEVLYELR